MKIEKNTLNIHTAEEVEFLQHVSDAIKAIDGVKKASVNFLMRKCNMRYEVATKVFQYLNDMGYVSEDFEVNQTFVCKFLNKEDTVSTKFIFLDVDGVLNCRTTKDHCGHYTGIEDEKVKHLKELVDITGAKIVLVSTWKEWWYKNPKLKDKQDDMATYLDEKLAKQGLTIYDKTNDEYCLSRGDAILEYIRAFKRKGNNLDKFVILDDELFDYLPTKLTKNLVRTSFENGGLRSKHIRKAVDILC